MPSLWSRLTQFVTAGAGAIVLSLSLSGAVATETACNPDQISLRGPWGSAQFSIEIADTAEERAQGLMHRASMPRGAGMLFVYDYPQRTAFWMKNTLIPLDMLFIDKSGVVTRIHENAIPGDLTPIEGGDKVFAVLEINGGLAARYGMTEGTQTRHEIFSKFGAIWAC
ncbi:DUF192 domain-containing protein [Phaeobacter italicus]|uniref:DUF192 domain-containing protein n=1 Tax=Phaeobacter italicus TaxID=481446 RepID=UPI001C97C40F|nr:DUF192 domain-containing protein [Phaeobacter italicus]MBY5975751.1 DUF192 domain-containing protein [Phaeobacter italicus]